MSSLHERKLHILNIVHSLLQKVICEQKLCLADCTMTGNEAIRFIFEAQRKFVLQAIQYLIHVKVGDAKTASTSYFFTNLVTYLNRVIVVDG